MKRAAFKARLSVSASETEWFAGTARTIHVTVKNVSPVTWPGHAVSGNRPVRLGNHWRDAEDRVIVNDDSRTELPHDLKPGEEVTLPLSVSIPGAPGRYRLELDMVQEAVAWFADRRSQTLLLNVDVVPDTQSKTPSAEAMARYVEERRHVSHAEFVVLAYQDILGHGLDEAGYSNWLTKLNEGVDRLELVAAFVNSAEAQARQGTTRPWSLPAFDRATPPPVPSRSSLEQYQDEWVNGSARSKGVRQCADRFELIRTFCAQYQRPFTVLDLGCNLGYFSLRLAETFDCTVVAAEGIYGEWTEEVLRENGKTRVILLKRVFTLDDLRALAAVEHFDVILALSVVHHLDGSFDESLEVLRSLGDHLILELPFEANACGPAIVEQAVKAQLPAEAHLMGYGKSHLAEGGRAIYSLSRPKTQLLKSYLGTPRTGLQLTVHSSFTEKRVEFANKDEPRLWHRGINLQTYLWFNGVWPARQDIAHMLQAQSLGAKAHRDIQPWNVILQGDAVQLIDCDDPNHLFAYDDSEYRDRLVRLLLAVAPAHAERSAEDVGSSGLRAGSG